MRNSPFAAKYRDIFCLIPAKYFKNNMLELNVSFLRDLFHFCEVSNNFAKMKQISQK